MCVSIKSQQSPYLHGPHIDDGEPRPPTPAPPQSLSPGAVAFGPRCGGSNGQWAAHLIKRGRGVGNDDERKRRGRETVEDNDDDDAANERDAISRILLLLLPTHSRTHLGAGGAHGCVLVVLAHVVSLR